jgi:HAD superfamily hydrolase (TIGR01509 family)
MLGALSLEYGLDIPPVDVDVLAKAEVEAVIGLLKTSLEPAPGAAAALEEVSHREPAPTLAVVSSSALRRVNVSLQKTGLDHFFGDRVYSDASSLAVPTSKPDPAIYLHAMLRLGVPPNACIAIEDSPSGTLSAVRAGIPTLGYVGAYTDGEREQVAKSLKDAGAKVIMNEWSDFERCLGEMGHPTA